jgi:hypothetical protein
MKEACAFRAILDSITVIRALPTALKARNVTRTGS